ncbi:Zinc finger CCHC [Branchiostoma belcheri]|nr:Zinc finger CCHC [Branchiostoma belcheri]
MTEKTMKKQTSMEKKAQRRKNVEQAAQEGLRRTAPLAPNGDSPIPYGLRVGDSIVYIRYLGQVKSCNKCGKQGHLFAECPTEKCGRCLQLKIELIQKLIQAQELQALRQFLVFVTQHDKYRPALAVQAGQPPVPLGGPEYGVWTYPRILACS